MKWIIFIFSMIPTIVVSAENVNNCVVQKQVIDMPPSRFQSDLGYCYAFSATQLLQQYFCKRKNGCVYSEKVPTTVDELRTSKICSNSDLLKKCDIPQDVIDDKLSVLDIMSQAGSSFKEGGDTARLLEKLKDGGLVAPEKCAPYLPFLKLGSDVFKEIKTVENADRKSRCQLVGFMKDYLDLRVSIEQIKESLFEPHMRAAYDNIFIPDDCKKRRLKLPQFKVHKLSLTNSEEIQSQLQKVLDLKSPISVGVCKTQSFLKAVTGRCNGHEMTVTGYEKNCCENNCTVRFKIQNSDPQYSVDENSLSEGHEFWIDGEKLSQQMALKSKMSIFLGGTNLTWISE